MPYRITKRHHFAAAHRLRKVPDGHPCGRQHGHNYVVELVLESEHLTDNDWVRDFGDLGRVWHFIDAEWDHRDLNAWFREHHLEHVDTTAEKLAEVLYNRFASGPLPELRAVRVSETPKTWAEYRVD